MFFLFQINLIENKVEAEAAIVVDKLETGGHVWYHCNLNSREAVILATMENKVSWFRFGKLSLRGKWGITGYGRV